MVSFRCTLFFRIEPFVHRDQIKNSPPVLNLPSLFILLSAYCCFVLSCHVIKPLSNALKGMCSVIVSLCITIFNSDSKDFTILSDTYCYAPYKSVRPTIWTITNRMYIFITCRDVSTLETCNFHLSCKAVISNAWISFFLTFMHDRYACNSHLTCVFIGKRPLSLLCWLSIMCVMLCVSSFCVCVIEAGYLSSAVSTSATVNSELSSLTRN